jgi:hypothetical protein
MATPWSGRGTDEQNDERYAEELRRPFVLFRNLKPCDDPRCPIHREVR